MNFSTLLLKGYHSFQYALEGCKKQENEISSKTLACHISKILIQLSWVRSPSLYILLVICFLCQGGCSKNSTHYQGMTFPPTEAVKFTFQKEALPGECRVFSHAIVTTPSNISSLAIQKSISENAKQKGADLVYLGLARVAHKRNSTGSFLFRAYGPENAYIFRDKWIEWEFGFKQWQKGKELVNLGYDNYSNPDVSFEKSIMMKHALLKCGPNLK